jgi:hypothetical protein
VHVRAAALTNGVTIAFSPRCARRDRRQRIVDRLLRLAGP